ncbi:MAG: hypothetical protein LBC75_04235 [Fibromonadaceae bacterium]|jgi:predicted RNA-binding Zn-ribbon protein involved in translation (DUF1610 family)|nr:hypothetical protein [Fibromonadaceae bacterium]
MDIKEYKCPNCGGTVNFDSSSQKMKCPYCDTEFEIAALEEYQKEIAAAKDNFGWSKEDAEQEWEQGELEDLSSGSCPSCGAELLGDANTVAMVCPCCGNAQIVSKRLSGFLKPDYVIPFKLEKNSAVKQLKNFCDGKKLLPDFFVKENHVNNVQGVYVPFWLFDAEASGRVCYKATKAKRTTDYIKTEYYSVVREGNLVFEKIPVDGSEKMDDKYMDAIEPFDYEQMKDFDTTYLAGYVAEKYDVDVERSKERAARRIKASVEREFENSVVGYDSVNIESSCVNVREGKYSYALFPVWILNTKYKEANYLFIMNGQSGRLVGKLPIDSKKIWKYGFIYSGILGPIFTALSLALGYEDPNFAWFIAIAWILALIMGFAYVFSWKSQMNTALLKNEANAYIVKDSLVFKKKNDNFLCSKVSKVPVKNNGRIRR